jgi:hypothetical protein
VIPVLDFLFPIMISGYVGYWQHDTIWKRSWLDCSRILNTAIIETIQLVLVAKLFHLDNLLLAMVWNNITR